MPTPPSDPNFVLLYVSNPPASAAFYQSLFGRAPVESSTNFALFVLNSGLRLGLWARRDAQPAPTAAAGATELCFAEPSNDAVRGRHAAWSALGLPVLQPPCEMDFGYTFTAADHDGHRLRVFAPAG